MKQTRKLINIQRSKKKTPKIYVTIVINYINKIGYCFLLIFH